MHINNIVCTLNASIFIYHISAVWEYAVNLYYFFVGSFNCDDGTSRNTKDENGSKKREENGGIIERENDIKQGNIKKLNSFLSCGTHIHGFRWVHELRCSEKCFIFWYEEFANTPKFTICEIVRCSLCMPRL